MKIPVTLPWWIVRDGTHRVPQVGDEVSYRTTFATASVDDLPSLILDATARAYKITNPNGTTRGDLIFSSFTASYFDLDFEPGQIKVTGRLYVDHELRVHAEGRLTGRVIDRKLLIEEELLPVDPKRLRDARSSKQELHEMKDGDQSLHPLGDAAPELGTVWRRPTGFVLTIQTD